MSDAEFAFGVLFSGYLIAMSAVFAFVKRKEKEERSKMQAQKIIPLYTTHNDYNVRLGIWLLLCFAMLLTGVVIIIRFYHL